LLTKDPIVRLVGPFVIAIVLSKKLKGEEGKENE
jgi:hypothetical protein